MSTSYTYMIVQMLTVVLSSCAYTFLTVERTLELGQLRMGIDGTKEDRFVL